MNLFSLLHFIISHPLNRAAPLSALSRFVRWQLASKVIGLPIAFPFVADTRLLARKGMTGATGNWYCGLHELSEMAFVLHSLRPGDHFVDVGANIGSYTVLAAGACGANVLCVEPHPRTHSWLLDNIRLNAISELVDARCCAVSAIPGAIEFTRDKDTMNHVAGPSDTGQTISVPTTTLDLLCSSQIPAVIKIDVEGHEMKVLAGAQSTMKRPEVRAVLLETNGVRGVKGNSPEDIIAIMRAFGFTPCRYDPFGRRILLMEEKVVANTIFVRDVEAAQLICQSAPYFSILTGTI